LELQGIVLRGRFTPEATRADSKDDLTLEWCERRLLARIHRLTLEGLRKQIEPVLAEQFVRFAFSHQHVAPASRLRGQIGLLEAIEQLQGFEAPAGHWERHLLPARVEDYDPSWLDMLTLTGQVVWGRLCPRRRDEDRARPAKPLTRSIPITLMLRRDLPWLLSTARPAAETEEMDPLAALGGNARAAYEALTRHGALFADQLAPILQALPSQVEEALGELAAAGLVTCDGFAPLRGIIASSDPRRRQIRTRRPSRRAPAPLGGGRWGLLANLAVGAPPSAANPEAERIENWCRLLLRRYGIVFRDLLARESAAPRWFELLRAFRTMEARGEIRGGRFVVGVAGEQYALGDAVVRLRQTEDGMGRLSIAATDPLNLFGRAGPGPKIPASPGNRLLVEHGRLIAYRMGGEIRFVDGAIGEESRRAVEGMLR
jgi:ATP-dependent Lhr-like helicase